MKRFATFAGALLPAQAFAQNQVEEPALQWMAWTWQTGAFFGVIACLLIGMSV